MARFHDDDRETEMLCPSCLAPNSPRNHFCESCAAPLSTHAAIDPLASVHAAGFVYGKAASQPRSLVVLIGMWLIFGSMFLANLPNVWFATWWVLSLVDLADGISTAHGVLAGVAGYSLILGIQVVTGLILYKVTRNYLKDRRAQLFTGDTESDDI